MTLTRPVPPKDSFPSVIQRTLELTGQKVPETSVRNLYKIFATLRWEFPDYGLSVYTVLDDEGRFNYADSIVGNPDAEITLNAEQLHQVVYGRGNMPKMFLTGKIKLKGVPKLKLIKFVPLMGPFLDSYKEACEGMVQ